MEKQDKQRHLGGEPRLDFLPLCAAWTIPDAGCTGTSAYVCRSEAVLGQTKARVCCLHPKKQAPLSCGDPASTRGIHYPSISTVYHRLYEQILCSVRHSDVYPTEAPGTRHPGSHCKFRRPTRHVIREHLLPRRKKYIAEKQSKGVCSEFVHDSIKSDKTSRQSMQNTGPRRKLVPGAKVNTCGIYSYLYTYSSATDNKRTAYKITDCTYPEQLFLRRVELLGTITATPPRLG